MNLARVETPFFLVCGRGCNLALHHLLGPMQCFIRDPGSGKLNLENHHLTLAIAKKTLDKISLGMHRKPQTGNHLLSNLETISRINDQENET